MAWLQNRTPAGPMDFTDRSALHKCHASITLDLFWCPACILCPASQGSKNGTCHDYTRKTSTSVNQALALCLTLVDQGLLFYTTISYVFLPWRSVFVTILDIGTHVSTLLLCLLLPFLIDFDQEEQQTAVCLRSNKNRGAYVAIPIFSLKVLGVAVINGHFWSSFHSAFILLSCG